MSDPSGDGTYAVDKTDDQWRSELSAAEYHVLRQAVQRSRTAASLVSAACLNAGSDISENVDQALRLTEAP